MAYRQEVRRVCDLDLARFVAECEKEGWEIAAMAGQSPGAIVVVVRKETTASNLYHWKPAPFIDYADPSLAGGRDRQEP